MKTLFLFILMFIGFRSYSQIKNIEVLLYKSEKYIRNYVDSLYQLKPSRFHKIESLTTENGNLLLSTQFDIKYESYFKVQYIIFKFQRLDGIEICVLQDIACSQKYSYDNLVTVKDTYELKSPGIWEKKLPGNMLLTQAKIEITKEGSFHLVYLLKEE